MGGTGTTGTMGGSTTTGTMGGTAGSTGTTTPQ
jgi:hypothetical protein